MSDTMVNWKDFVKVEADINTPSVENMPRINIPRDGHDSLNFRPVYKPYLFFQYWNEDDTENIRYGENYYALSSYFGCKGDRLRELGYPTHCPQKLCMSTVVSMLIIDRKDGKLKVLELPWNLFYEMSNYASMEALNLGDKEGVDWTMRKKENGGYLISTGGVNTPFTLEEKPMIMNLLKDNGEALHDFYARRIVDIEVILEHLHIDPQDVYKEPVKKVVETITIPSMEFDEFYGSDINMDCIELGVLKNLRILASSKEYDRHLSNEMSTQELINMEMFMIESQAEVAKREYGMPLSKGIRKLLKTKYDTTLSWVEEFISEYEDGEFELIIE